MKRLPFLTQIASCATLLLPIAAASAAQLDWDAVTQTNGSQNNTFTVGNTQVNVVVSNPTNGAFGPTVANGTTNSPAITKDLEGGTSPVQNSLVIAADFGANTASLTVTVSFKTLSGTPQQVNGVNFDLYDIDLGTNSWVDQIRTVQGVLGSNTTIKPTSVVGNTAGNSVTGNSTTGFTITGTAQIDNTGANSNQANATVNFGTQAITGFSFVYGDDTSAPADPVRQVFALHDINFAPVPEPNTASMIGLGGLLAGFIFFRRRSQPSVN